MGEGEFGKIFPIVATQRISRTSEARYFVCISMARGCNKKYAKVGHRG